MKIKEIIARYESYCPQELSLDGDISGLQFGSLEQDVKKMMISLDIRETTVAEAIAEGVNFILVKHAPIFKSIKDFKDSPQIEIYKELIKHDIAVYVSHTNIDVVPDGLNDWFCNLLDIQDVTYLERTSANHGIGRIGQVEKQTFEDFTKKVKKVFNLPSLRMIRYNKDNPVIERVAICGGSGSSFYSRAIEKEADVYITGDIYYHTAQEMLTNGLLALDPGHYIEVLFVEKLLEKFNQWKSEDKWDLDIIGSQVSTNPFEEWI